MNTITRQITKINNNSNFLRADDVIKVGLDNLKFAYAKKVPACEFLVDDKTYQVGSYISGSKIVSIYEKKSIGKSIAGTINFKHEDSLSLQMEKLFPSIIPRYFDDRGDWLSHIFINKLTSNNSGRGVGSKLVVQAIEESKNSGYEGRVLLEAYDKSRNPIPFYKKLGFRCANREFDQKLDVLIPKLSRSELKNIDFSKYGLSELNNPVGMYLPLDKVVELLGKYKNLDIFA